MDSEVLIFGTASLFAGILALVVIQFYTVPADEAGNVRPAFYDVVQRQPFSTDTIPQ